MSNVVEMETGGDVAECPCAVTLVSRAELALSKHWAKAFASQRKDHRYYELVEDTLSEGFDYRYFAIRDADGEIIAVQPFFILDQDIVLGAGPATGGLVEAVRRLWPRFLMLRTLMVGCVAGEGHLDGRDAALAGNAQALAAAIVGHARALRAPLIVLKEFPKAYRAPLRCFLDRGFARAPSLPMTCLNIDYANFDDYMTRALNSATRRKLRKKFKIAEQAAPIDMSLVDDISPFVDEIYPLYLQVYDRSKLHFEKLTKAFFCEIGRRMPDKARFFVWRQHGRIVAFSLCLVEGDGFYAEYIGLDYAVALSLHLYHYAVRDMTTWAIANGYRWFRSSGLNYDPKLHLRHRLDPIDLYVRHASPLANAVLQRVLPWIEPTRSDPILKLFPNYDELWN
jgi:peptidoglycan biosynthesis/recognition FemAB-like protein